MLLMAFFFGLFQALNPFFGWLGTRYFRYLIESVDHWIAFAILGFLGIRISFVCMGMNDWSDLSYPLAVIGLVSFIMSLVGVFLGVRCGRYAKKIHADLLGGIILFAIGVKVLIEHLSA